MSDKTVKRIEKDDPEAFGSKAVLVCGYRPEEAQAVAGLLETIGVPGHTILLCTLSKLSQTLEQALCATDPAPPVPEDKLPPVMILSGMSGSRIHAFIDGFPSTGLPRPIFASATQSNLQFIVRDLIIELLKEHQVMMENR